VGNSVTHEQLLSISRSTRLYQSMCIIIKCSSPCSNARVTLYWQIY